MILGMSLGTFTLIHVLISLVAIASGIVVVYGFLTKQRFERFTAVFLVMTGLTSLTGFLFPFTSATPAIKLGIISLGVLAICGCHAVSPAPDLEENFRDRGMHGVVLQCLRFCGAII